jgi:alkaline phosphatase D
MRPARAPGRGVESACLRLGPLLGHIGPDEARVWAQASGATRLGVRVGQKEDLSDGRVVAGPCLAVSNDFVGQVRVSDLTPSVRYFYCVLLDSQPALAPPYPAFVTAPPANSRGRVRFAFGSCVGYHGFDSAPTWAEMATRTNFDLLLMLGDNHYANSTDPKVLGEYFGAQRRLAAYREIALRVPQYAIWDNHDYAPEPCDRTAKDQERSLRVFGDYWPNPSSGEPENRGVYHKFSRAGVEFFMLDDRYYRSPDKDPDDGSKTLLGERQLAWLKRGLAQSRARVKVLGSGCEWESHGPKNSWATFKRERDEIFKFIQDHGINGVILLSGDRHFTAAYQVMGKFIEVTSGPLGSSNAETRPTPEMFYYGGKGKFFCIFDIDTVGEQPAVTLEVYRTGDGLVHRRAFSWKEVLGEKRIEPLAAGVATRKQGKTPSADKSTASEKSRSE